MFNSKTHKKNIIVFDIDSTTIAGGIFEYTYTDKGEIHSIRNLFEIRESISEGKSYPFTEFWRRTQKTLESVVFKVYEQSFIPFEDIFINVSAPWTSAQKQTLHYEKKKEFIFTQELTDALIEKKITAPLSKNLDYHGHKVSLIDRRTIKVSCDGYPTRNPIGKNIYELSIDSLVTVISLDSKKGFEDIIEKHFHRLPQFISNTFVSYDDVIQVLPDIDNALVLDVSGSMTEMFIIRHDYLEQTAAFPLGTHTIIGSIAHRRNISHLKAHRLIHLAYEGTLDTRYYQELKEEIDTAFRTWLKNFYAILDVFTQQGLINNTLVLKIDRKDYSWFSQLIMESDEILEHLKGKGRFILINIMDAREKNIHHNSKDEELALVAECIGNHHLLVKKKI